MIALFSTPTVKILVGIGFLLIVAILFYTINKRKKKNEK